MSRLPALIEHLEARTLLALVTWDGGGGDNLWGNPLNWSGDVLPGSADDVVLEIAGPAQEIRVDGGLHKIKSFASHEDLRISFGQLRVTGAAWMYGTLTLDGGQLLTDFWKQSGELRLESGDIMGTGVAPFIIAGGGLWTGGRLLGPGAAQITAASGAFSMSGNLTLGRALVIDVPLTWTSGTVVLQDEGRFELLAGHTLTMTDDTVFGGEGDGVFIRGTLAAAGGRINPGLFCGGPGASIQVSGILTLAHGGLACPVNIGAAGEIWVDSAVTKNVNLQPGVVVSATGNWRVFDGGLAVYEPSVVLPSLRVGTADTFGRLIVKASATFGEIDLTHGALKIFAGVQFKITDSMFVADESLIGADVKGAGLRIMPGGSMHLQVSAPLTQHEMLIRNDGLLFVQGGSNYSLRAHVENHGTMRVKGDLSLTAITVGGLVEVLEGQLIVPGRSPGFGGELRLHEGATAFLYASFHLLNSGRVTGEGALDIGQTFSGEALIEGDIDVGTLAIFGHTKWMGASIKYGSLILGQGQWLGHDDADLDGLIAWKNLKFGGTGAIRFLESSVVELSGHAGVTSQTVQVLGRVDFLASARLSLDGVGRVEVLPQGVFRTFGGTVDAGGGVFLSQGTFAKYTSTTCWVKGSELRLDGLTEVHDGLLRVGGGRHAGTFALDLPGILRLGEPSFGPEINLWPDSAVTGPGKLVFGEGQARVLGAIDVSFMVVTGQGDGPTLATLDFAGPKTTGKLQVDKGELIIGAAADLKVGTYYTHKGGTLRLRVAGTQSGKYASVNVGSVLTIKPGSTLALDLKGFKPKAGDTFDVLTWAKRAGTFSHVDVTGVPPGLVAKLVYLQDRAQLRIEKV